MRDIRFEYFGVERKIQRERVKRVSLLLRFFVCFNGRLRMSLI